MQTKQLFLLASMIFLAWNLSAQTSVKKAIKKYKAGLEHFQYEGHAFNDFVFGKKSKKINVEFTAMAGVNYRLLFCKTDFGGDVTVKIYNKPSKNKSRKLLFDNSQNLQNEYWTFEPEKRGTYYIEYEVSSSSTVKDAKKGYMIMMVGANMVNESRRELVAAYAEEY